MLLQPDFGLFFWTAICFLILLFILRKFAWKLITDGLKEREESIDKSLRAAEKARHDVEKLHTDNERILNEAKEERSKLLREAKELKDSIIRDAGDKAKEEASRILMEASREIERQKVAAINEVKNQVGAFAIDVAEKILRKKMEDSREQEIYISELVSELK